MVATVSALSNAAQAASYYEADDYYAEGGLAPSEWQGKGAEVLKLQGAVEYDQFSRLLEGRVADQQLGTAREGEIAHRPGWDLTFSAPKSVSILAEVAGDRRLVEAHERAVRTALGLAETHFAATRIREDGEVRRETTGNLVIATFRHGTSRALDPQLHSHNVILNMTQNDNGQWRSLEPRAFYQLQKQLGAIYRQELAAEVQRLGYAIDRGKEAGFEVAGLDAATLEAFSQRSQEIEAHLSQRGTSREAASAAEKQMAALDTRQAKEAVPHADLVREWRAVANAAGWDEQARREMIAQADARARTQATAEDVEHAFARECAADRAVARGASMLGERQAVFATTALHEAAGRFAFGEVGHVEIGAAIVRAQKSGALEARSFVDRRGAAFEGMTTAANIADEAALLRLEESGRNQAEPILAPVAAARVVAQAERRAEAQGHDWNDEQRTATTQILTSRNRIVALQGAAGTAKTSTVLTTVAEEAQARGLRVTALAPTASAAQVLGDALGSRADTLARHLLAPGRPTAADQLWIVDEASLVSARDTAKLLALAETHRARVLLVGDAKKALAALDSGGGHVVEHEGREARFEQMARDFAVLDGKARKRTLVIEPSRDGRDTLTGKIRDKLAETGALHGPAVELSRLVARDMTRTEAKETSSYAIGDVVRFTKDYANKGVSRLDAYTVTGIDMKKAAVTLAASDGRRIDWRLRQWGATQSQVFTVEPIELRAGDRMQFTRNDRAAGRVNGQQGEVVAVDSQTRTVTLRMAKGRIEHLTPNDLRDRHIAHAWVATAFAAQGRTADRVLVHADSAASQLVDQKSFYVALSRARESVAVYTNDRAKLISAVQERSGIKQTALAPVAGAALAAGTQTVDIRRKAAAKGMAL